MKKINYSDYVCYQLYIHRLCILYIIIGYILGERRSPWIFFNGTATPLHYTTECCRLNILTVLYLISSFDINIILQGFLEFYFL